jgi:hypothetical protein
LLQENIGRFLHNSSAATFFSRVSGTDALLANLAGQLQAVGKLLLLLLTAFIAGNDSRRFGKNRLTVNVYRAVAFFLYGLLVWQWADTGLFAALPIVAAAALVYACLCERASPLLPLSLFVLALSPRILFNYSPNWYGFYLAVPGYLFISYLFGYRLRYLPGFSRRVGAAVAVIALVMLVRFEQNSWHAYRQMTAVIQTPKGRMHDFASGRAEALNAFFRYVRANRVVGEGSAVVFPEGVSLNYFTGLKQPLGHYSFIPPEIDTPLAEQRALADLQRSPPDYVVMVPRDVAEFDRVGFGQDYGVAISRWLQENYTLAETFSGSGKPLWSIALLKNNHGAGRGR